MGCSKSSKRELYSDAGLPQETRKITNKLPNITSKLISKRTKPKVIRKEEIISERN